jgi:hypothetical protein
MKFSVMLLAVAVVIELLWFIGVDRYVEPVSVSIESTELWYNPWPAPGHQTGVANGCGEADSRRAAKYCERSLILPLLESD